MALAGDPDQIEEASYCHISYHLFLLWSEFEHLRINESMEYIFEDVVTFGGVFKHPVVYAVVRVICFTHLFMTTCLWQLELITFVKQLKQRDNMLILKEILLISACLLYRAVPSSRFMLGRRFDLCYKSVPSSRLRR